MKKKKKLVTEPELKIEWPVADEEALKRWKEAAAGWKKVGDRAKS